MVSGGRVGTSLRSRMTRLCRIRTQAKGSSSTPRLSLPTLPGSCVWAPLRGQQPAAVTLTVSLVPRTWEVSALLQSTWHVVSKRRIEPCDQIGYSAAGLGGPPVLSRHTSVATPVFPLLLRCRHRVQQPGLTQPALVARCAQQSPRQDTVSSCFLSAMMELCLCV